MIKLGIILLMSFFLMLIFNTCEENSSKPQETTGNITGTVMDLLSGNALISDSAYIYLKGDLVAKTDGSGKYTISSLEEGTYILVCSTSSDFFREEVDTVEVIAGKTITHDFYLIATREITGMVRNLFSGDVITSEPAYIYLDNTILASTNIDGSYLISSLPEGIYNFKCTSLFYHDTTETVEIIKGQTVTHDFYLQQGTGEIYGEFQDLYLFDSLVVEKPEMAEWDEKEVFDGTTGATLIGKFVNQYVEKGEVFLGDSLLDQADTWGIYGATLPAGNYTLRGSCAGGDSLHYEDEIINVEILPDSVHYANFFLPRKTYSMLRKR